MTTNLYLIGTPIGNLSDISKRAIDTLNNVHTVVAEDTRVTKKLLSHYDINKPIMSFNSKNYKSKIASIQKLLKNYDIGLTTDAGTPGISDPGYELITSVESLDVNIIPIPGPSALTSAISVSGFPINQFYFAGFAPRRESELRTFLDSIEKLNVPIIMFESPNRIKKLLELLIKYAHHKNVLIMREMTKIYEERFYGSLQDALSNFQNPKGEITLILEPSGLSIQSFTDKEIFELINKFKSDGLGTKSIAQELSKVTNLSRSESYKKIIDSKDI
ncbi:MAG: 16S rRNA (cytidine(1402)-2'-O)-methyltransferase [Dehalococcoidia bacterium]